MDATFPGVSPKAPVTLAGEASDVSVAGSIPPGSSSFQVGDVLRGIYEVRGVLGQGGMGEVYDAWDLRLHRRIAIKTSRPGLPHVALEARALAALRHPALVSVHALDEHEGVPFMVMEHVPGTTLKDHIDKRRISGEGLVVEEALDVLLGIAEGLAAVHRAGIAHRDLTPANVMLAPGSRVVLTDFGLMQPESGAPSKPGYLAGTPAYMAPEVFRRDVAPGAAHLVDVYALGVIAFEMLTTRLPYEATTLLGYETLHREASVPEPIGPEPVPPRLTALVRELLGKEPRERPSVESVVWQLRAIRNQLGRLSSNDGPLRVLVVDDERYTSQLLAMYVRHASPDAEILVANNAKQALDQVKKRPPDIMVLDLVMPDMGGIELFMYLRGERLAERCNIVAVSIDAAPGDVELLYELGVAMFLPKDAALQTQLKAFVTEYLHCRQTGETPRSMRPSRRVVTNE